MKTLEERFEDKYIPEPNSGCWLWVGATNNKGYGYVQIGAWKIMAHRISWVIHNGFIPDGFYVLHKCDVRCCVNPGHLFLGTLKDNMQDCLRKGRFAHGEKNGASKLTASQAGDIRLQLSFGHTQRSVAEKYGVCEATISDIKTKRTWKHL